MRDAWVRFLMEVGPFNLFPTLGFSCWIDPDRALFSAQHFLQRIHRALYGIRFNNQGRFLEGVVIAEKKRVSRLGAGGIHFHFLLRLLMCCCSRGGGGSRTCEVPGRVVGWQSLPEVCVACVRGAAVNASMRLRYPNEMMGHRNTRRISGEKYVDVRAITDPLGLAKYLTKQLARAPRDESLRIGFVNGSVISGLDLTDSGTHRGVPRRNLR